MTVDGDVTPLTADEGGPRSERALLAAARLHLELTATLSRSLNLRQTVLRLLDLVTPRIADWAVVVLADRAVRGHHADVHRRRGRGQGADGFYGMDRLLAPLPECAGAGPMAVCEAVEQDVVEYLDGRAHDDIALLAVSCEK